MKHLYAPWREAWITGEEGSPPEGKEPSCLFCRVHGSPHRDRDNLVVHREERGLVMLNRFPYNGGHLLVAPRSHHPSIDALDPGERNLLLELAARAVRVLGDLYGPHGFNIGINQGAAAGAGIPGHVHLHVVPRWEGDTNFMTTLGEVRVLSQDLDRVRDELAGAWERGAAD